MSNVPRAEIAHGSGELTAPDGRKFRLHPLVTVELPKTGQVICLCEAVPIQSAAGEPSVEVMLGQLGKILKEQFGVDMEVTKVDLTELGCKAPEQCCAAPSAPPTEIDELRAQVGNLQDRLAKEKVRVCDLEAAKSRADFEAQQKRKRPSRAKRNHEIKSTNVGKILRDAAKKSMRRR